MWLRYTPSSVGAAASSVNDRGDDPPFAAMVDARTSTSAPWVWDLGLRVEGSELRVEG